MTFHDRLIHTLLIERSTSGALDTYGQPAQTWSALATVPGLVLPKTAREMALTSQQGAEIADHTVFMEITDVTAADRVRLVPDDGRIFELTAVKNFIDHHLECDAVAIV